MTKTRLPDFSTSKVWQGIREKMGAVDDASLPELSIGGISLSEIKKLKSGSISIDNIHEHINPIDGTFDYKGQKVILYIKQQRYNMQNTFYKPSYKYHLCYCSTLRDMEARGRFKSRYVVTQRTDGKFLIDLIDAFSGKYHEQDRLYEMDVCKNCLSKLSRTYTTDPLFTFHQFSLSDFISKYNTKHIKKPIYTPKNLPKNEYSSNWNKLSRELREKANWMCSKCRGDFHQDKSNLHVHHKDGCKWNETLENLEVLCINCHSKEPGHAKLKYKNRKKNAA